MSYDFLVFVPEETITVDDGDWTRLRLRADRVEVTGHPALESLRDTINAGGLPEDVTLADGHVRLIGDRCLLMPVEESSVPAAGQWLSAVSLENHLGLASATEEAVIFHGDETDEFTTETAAVDMPTYSPAALGHLLDSVKQVQIDGYTEDGPQDFADDFLIVGQAGKPEYYMQAVYRPAEQRWQVEYRLGAQTRHFLTTMSAQEDVEQAYADWTSRSTGYQSRHEWTLLEFPEAVIDYSQEHDH